MGWKGTIRSINAAARRAERAEAKRQRELEKRYKHFQKMEAFEQAKGEVEVYENYIERLRSIHKEVTEPIDWESLIISDDQKPEKNNKNKEKAEFELSIYKPSILDKLLFRIEKKKRLLKENIIVAKRKDEKEFQQALNIFLKMKEESEIAKKVLNNEKDAFSEAMDHFSKSTQFADINDIATKVLFEIDGNKSISAKVFVHEDDVIPFESKALLKSGKLSTKKIPEGKRNQMRQDYVCSCVLRVANEIFSILPVDITIVTAMDKVLNTSTGHREEVPVLSVAISRDTLSGINLDTIDPSDSMKNFVHNMSFKNTLGFCRVEEINKDRLNKIRPAS